MYTYLAIRMAVVAIALYLLYRILVERGFLRRNWQGLIVFAAFYALTFAPLGRHLHQRPLHPAQPQPASQHPHDIDMAGGDLQPLWESVSRHLQMFHIAGDANPRHNLPRRADARPHHRRFLPAGPGLGDVALARSSPRPAADLDRRHLAGRHPLAPG